MLLFVLILVDTADASVESVGRTRTSGILELVRQRGCTFDGKRFDPPHGVRILRTTRYGGLRQALNDATAFGSISCQPCYISHITIYLGSLNKSDRDPNADMYKNEDYRTDQSPRHKPANMLAISVLLYRTYFPFPLSTS